MKLSLINSFLLFLWPLTSFLANAKDIDLSSASRTTSIYGISPNGYFGNSVASGDVNGDGIEDAIIGDMEAYATLGAVYIVYGSYSGFQDTNLATLSSSNRGFEVRGPAAGSAFGYSVSNAGDINHDGVDDIVIGAYKLNGERGGVYVIYGKKDGSSDINLANGLTRDQGFKITSLTFLHTLCHFGISVGSAGDVNKDGIDDFIVGANNYDDLTVIGAVFVIYGKAGGLGNIDLDTTPITASSPNPIGFRITAPSSLNFLLGLPVGKAGDINGDGIDDIFVGARAPTAGYNVYIIYGSSATPVDINVNTLTTTQKGFKVGGIPGDWLPFAVNSAGDINGDGIDDLIIGLSMVNSDSGAAVLISREVNKAILQKYPVKIAIR